MGVCVSTPAPAFDMPESVAFFFNGEPMSGKAEKYMTEMVADSHTLEFVGPHALPLGKLDKAAFAGAAGNLAGSFPDLTFNFNKATPKRNKDGSWSADIVVMGTHTGAAFTPKPGELPPIDTTGKCVKIGPETFTLWTDDKGKVCKTEITPLGKGHPHGPPGFYLEIGGSLAPPAAAPNPDCLMQAQVKDFADWFQGFEAHATKTTFPMNGQTYTVPMARGEACDEDKTLVFTDVADPNAVVMMLYNMDMGKFGPVMADPQFVAMSEAAIVSQAPPLIMADPGPTETSTSMFFCVEVEDVDKWIEGFQAHGSSKSGTWGYEVPITRGEFCDEAKTRVFKCATKGKTSFVGAYMEGMQMDKLGPLLGDENMMKLTKDLGEKDGTKVMKVAKPMGP